MTVCRISKRDSWFSISRHPLEDPKLSLKSKGLWAYCMSKPNGWTFHINQLSTVSQADGKHSVYSAIKELIKNGYVKKIQTNEKGKFGKVDYIIFEECQINNTEIKEILPLRDLPHAVNPPLVNNDIQGSISSNEDIDKKKKERVCEPESGDSASLSFPNKGLPEEATKIAEKILLKVKERNPKVKAPVLKKWAEELDVMNRRDERTWAEMEEMVDWAFQDLFWMRVIQSPQGLRKNWDKMSMQRIPVRNKNIDKKVQSYDPMPVPTGRVYRDYDPKDVEKDDEFLGKIRTWYEENRGKGKRARGFDVFFGNQTVSFQIGSHCETFHCGEVNFEQKCLNQLQKRGLYPLGTQQEVG